ncbi:MAG: adenylate/guanylate cyclase domain-containing protein [Planctomycetes bacterium]|nr:adenylate/guanylate cyclase domain-containing protein [Planctomycetota bacterium]
MESEVREQVDALEGELARMRALRAFSGLVDQALEEVERRREGLSAAMNATLPLLRDRLGAREVFLRTLDESLALATYRSSRPGLTLGADELNAAEGAARANGRRATLDLAGGRVLVRVLDVAGEAFGVVGAAWPQETGPDADEAWDYLLAYAEEVDNLLAAVRTARVKQRLLMSLTDALKDPLLDRGIERAVGVLLHHVAFDRLFLSYRHEDRYYDERLYRKVFEGARLVYDSERDGDASAHPEAIREWVALGEEALAIPAIARGQIQEAIIYGMKEEVRLGRILVVSSREDMGSTFNRDVLEIFANAICQRIVDHGKEARFLNQSFGRAHTARLLAQEDYRERYLTPRSRPVAMLYADIAGFTRLSEQRLKDPERVGHFIDRWSRGAVEILWRHEGVFDKLVGDCVIGLFGPPFFDRPVVESCLAAVRTAEEIRDFTRSLGQGPLGREFPELAQEAVGVATGLNLAPLNVGLFGPNFDYTGFSSGMNNTARLQGVARLDQVLVMEEMAAALDGRGLRLGPPQEAAVKNVARPLRYRELLA